MVIYGVKWQKYGKMLMSLKYYLSLSPPKACKDRTKSMCKVGSSQFMGTAGKTLKSQEECFPFSILSGYYYNIYYCCELIMRLWLCSINM